MKRIVASGVGVVALGAFLVYQPVAGSTGGLTLAPTAPESSASAQPGATSEAPSVEKTPAATTEVTVKTPAKKGLSTSGSSGALLRDGNSSQPPSISGGPGGEDDEGDDRGESGDRHHGKRHHDDSDGEGFEPHDD